MRLGESQADPKFQVSLGHMGETVSQEKQTDGGLEVQSSDRAIT